MRTWAVEHSMGSIRRVGGSRFRTLFAITSFSICGCAATDFWSGYAIEPEPMPCHTAACNTAAACTLPWNEPATVFGTPAWGAGPAVFGTPALGGAPNVYGNRLHVPPGESAAAKVLALNEQIAVSKAENEQLTNRIKGLEAEVEAGNKALARATNEVMETRKELGTARADLDQWKRDIATMREKLEAADKENLSTLQSTVGLLQKLMANEHAAADGE